VHFASNFNANSTIGYTTVEKSTKYKKLMLFHGHAKTVHIAFWCVFSDLWNHQLLNDLTTNTFWPAKKKTDGGESCSIVLVFSCVLNL